MRRILATVAVLAVAASFVLLATGAGHSGEPSGHTYWVEMDNAFGLIMGGDMKVAGVRAGKISAIKLDRATNRALIGFNINVNGFGSLREDVTCSSRPQSLIGEYYLDCEPGSAPQLLSNNSQTNPIPVTHTSSTISTDLVQDIFRQPYRQRFSIILSELGAGVAGNGQNLNDAVRRAVPALQQTDTVLAILARQNHTLADLAVKADAVLHDLSNNRQDVARFIVSARGAAVDTASQKAALQQGFAELPRFLGELRPAMASLGNVATQTTPALANLSASADQLRQLFNNIGPFANASTPGFAALGRASVTGDQAVKAAAPLIAQLNAFAKGTPELSQNLSIILNHLDNPAYGATRDPRAVAQHPVDHSNTYTGLEALLQYVFDQGQGINTFGADGHLLALATLVDPTTCSPYADAARAKANPQCRSWLGPTQPGVTTPDPTKMVASGSGGAPGGGAPGTPGPPALPVKVPVKLPVSQTTTTAAAPTCVVGICLPAQAPSVPVPSGASGAAGTAATGAPAPTVTSSNDQSLLGYLLGP